MPTYKKMKVTKAKDIRKLCADKGVKVDFILSHKLAKAFLACDLEKWIALGGSFDYLYNPYVKILSQIFCMGFLVVFIDHGRGLIR